MNFYHWVGGCIIMALLLVYFAVEMGWGGGDQNSSGHNRPPWSLW